jgi:hypothetical protein
MIDETLLAALDGRPAAEMNGVEKIAAAAATYYRRMAGQVSGVEKILAAAEPHRRRQSADLSLVAKLRQAAGEPDPSMAPMIAKANTIAPRLLAVRQAVGGSMGRLAKADCQIRDAQKRDAEAAADRHAVLELAQRRQYPLSPHAAPLTYFAFRDELAAEIQTGTVECTPAALVHRAGRIAGIAPDVAAEWVETFLADMYPSAGGRLVRVKG